jgi:hypothetical protein
MGYIAPDLVRHHRISILPVMLNSLILILVSSIAAITSHLRKLIEKKILSMGVDALSTLLTKNPRFNLLPVDLAFLKTFQVVWRGLEGDDHHSNFDRSEVIYQLPNACYDPGLLLMFFRHNISGSTFFHIRNDPSQDEKSGTSDIGETMQTGGDADQGAAFYFHERDFALYFNASPAQLDPTFQPVTTLTEAGTVFQYFYVHKCIFTLTGKLFIIGLRFSRLCGTGIALIDVKLLRNSDQHINKFLIGKTPIEEESRLIPDLDSLKLKRMPNVLSLEKDSNGIVVSIVNTTLDADILHRWIGM